MKERINRLARGILDMDTPQIVVLPENIQDTIQAGKTISREFQVNSGNNLHIKGLVYTDHTRITIDTPAFGGLRNRISYRVDASHLENGDQIQGEFQLVTSGGERTLPFSFTVELGISGQTLAGLKTAEDFAKLAKADPETALRLFDYQDFTETPFMQDMYPRALYDGLKGHADRGNQLEEFLVALNVKKPVSLDIASGLRTYACPEQAVEDVIEIKKQSWGYVTVDVQTDGLFLEMAKRHFGSGDFEDGVLRIPYRILPGRLHRGRNFGCICLNTAKESIRIPVEVSGDPETDENRRESRRARKAFGRFMELRLHGAEGQLDMSFLRSRMVKELDVVNVPAGDKVKASLWMAETLIQSGKKEQAALVLDECRDSILMSRREQIEEYCFYQYLQQQLQPNISQKESLLRLVRKYMSEGRHPALFFIRLKLDETVYETPVTLFMDMKKLYEEGFHSPFLYLEAYQIVKDHPEFFQKTDGFLLQVLNFAAKNKIMEEDMAVRTASAANLEKHYSRLFHRILAALYDSYPRKEILEAVCCMMIKGECRKPEDFHWYEAALEEGISLTRLYEYYLYALPKKYSHLLPKEVLLYFSYGHDLDRHSRSVLYKNILLFMNPSSKLYQAYERDMEQFAMEQLFESRINSRLAVIYDHMIFKEMIDQPIARVLPAVLRSYRISCRNRQMKYVIVRYEELTKEDAYLLTDGVAYVPLFSEKTVILFQDAFGNRYADVQYLKTPVMDKSELEKRCFEVYPQHPELCLAACRRIAGQSEELEEGQVQILERAMKELPLNGLYRKALLSRVIEYYRARAEEEEGDRGGCDYLLTLDVDEMNHQERLDVCETLISRNYLEEAYAILKAYGWEGISTLRLQKLCGKTILENLFDEDDFLLKLSWQVFARGKADSVLLDYLCEHFNGNSEQMYKLLTQGKAARVETYDLDERLLCQMMFSGSLDHLDQVFHHYSRRNRMRETVIKAYFTVKTVGYFLKHEAGEAEVFAYLEALLNQEEELEKVPVIYLLALTKYYSECSHLDEEQTALCGRMTDLLTEEGLIFPYTKKLSRFVPVSQDVLDKAMVCYEGSRDAKPELLIRILPDEEEFHPEELHRIYQGIFVCRKVLFEGETLEYQIYCRTSLGEPVLVKEGSAGCELLSKNLKESRFASLNDMGLCLSMKEEAGLKKSMQDYLMKNGALEELFPLVP
ncbi:MAG: DUF5717 family protein [Lachnospiraceae bacterium]|nr:DUF5717 family protein [Lachnospiraceae bacterium]